jgi:hypothetical protein
MIYSIGIDNVHPLLMPKLSLCHPLVQIKDLSAEMLRLNNHGQEECRLNSLKLPLCVGDEMGRMVNSGQVVTQVRYGWAGVFADGTQ